MRAWRARWSTSVTNRAADSCVDECGEPVVVDRQLRPNTTVLSLLGALGAVGLIAALLNYMGINLQEYFEQFLDMLP